MISRVNWYRGEWNSLNGICVCVLIYVFCFDWLVWVKLMVFKEIGECLVRYSWGFDLLFFVSWNLSELFCKIEKFKVWCSMLKLMFFLNLMYVVRL